MQPSLPPNPTSESESESPLLREYRENANKLLRSIKHHLPKLEELLSQVESHWEMEDGVYRFYHQSFKVYHLQNETAAICQALKNLMPDRPLNKWFSEIVAQGTGHEFEMSHNQDWLRHTQPILEALFHAHYFLNMAVKHGKELENAPDRMPSGWAVVLYLFDLR